MDVVANSQDITTYFVMRLAADGTEATGLTVTNFDLQYVRSGSSPSAKVDASALGSVDAAHADNSCAEIDATDQPGLYRIDWPDAAFASGAREVILTVKCATCFTEHLRVNLTAVPANVTHWLSTAAATPTTAGVPEVDITFINGSAVSTSTAQLGVNVVNFGGSAGTFSSGVPAVSLGNVAHGGTSATLRLGGSTSTPALYVTNSGGDAVQLESTGNNGYGLDVIGNGSGHGAHLVGGATGSGAQFVGGATSGHGLAAFAITGNAINCTVDSNGYSGIYAAGTGNGGHGIYATGTTGTGDGIHALAGGTGVGLRLDNATVTGALTAATNSLPRNASWDTEVQSECADALTAYGAATSANVSAVETDTQDIQSRLPAALTSGRIDASVGAMQTDVLTSTALAASAVSEIQSGLSTLDAAGIRTAVGLASANLDTQLSAIDDYVDSEVAAIYSRIGAPAGASIAADIAAIKAETASILDDTGTSGVVVASASKTGYTLAAAGLDSITIETSLNARQALSVIAACAGQVSGGGSATVVIAACGVPATTRVTSVCDSAGNRSSVTLNLPS